MNIDLASNTIDGRRVRPRVAELAVILSDGPVATDSVIRKLYGLGEPENALNALKQIAWDARRKGVRIAGRIGRGGFYQLTETTNGL